MFDRRVHLRAIKHRVINTEGSLRNVCLGLVAIHTSSNRVRRHGRLRGCGILALIVCGHVERRRKIHGADETGERGNRLLAHISPKLGDICADITRTAGRCHGLSGVGGCSHNVRDFPVHGAGYIHFDVISTRRHDRLEIIGLDLQTAINARWDSG